LKTPPKSEILLAPTKQRNIYNVMSPAMVLPPSLSFVAFFSDDWIRSGQSNLRAMSWLFSLLLPSASLVASIYLMILLKIQIMAGSRSFFINTKVAIAMFADYVRTICLVVEGDGDIRATTCARNDHVYY